VNMQNDTKNLNITLTNTVFLTTEISKEDKDKVCSRLYNHNVKNTNGLLHKPGFDINLCLKDGDTTIGAILCDTFNYCMYIDALWIDEKYRGYGYGKELIYQAERIAKDNGCIFSHTSTFNYQSPKFYQACGCEIFAELDNYPDNITQYFLKKTFKNE
jgi:ribosomal protein S18 acetylase RimI-like enzyme